MCLCLLLREMYDLWPMMMSNFVAYLIITSWFTMTDEHQPRWQHLTDDEHTLSYTLLYILRWLATEYSWKVSKLFNGTKSEFYRWRFPPVGLYIYLIMKMIPLSLRYESTDKNFTLTYFSRSHGSVQGHMIVGLRFTSKKYIYETRKW